MATIWSKILPWTWCGYTPSILPRASPAALEDCGYAPSVPPEVQVSLVSEDVRPLPQTVSYDIQSLGKYDVFLNHRGPDVKDKFVAHLYDALYAAGFHPFLDAKSLIKGEHAYKSINEALSGVGVHVAIFSKGYAESKYCLDELHDMLESGKLILPVFYGVEVEHLCRPYDGPFAAGLRQHKRRGRHQDVERWETALAKVADLQGFRLAEFNGDEAQLKRRIVLRVQRALPARRLQQVAPHRVGLEESLKIVIKKLNLMGDSVGVIGVFGMGGIGKTTLVREVYNHFAMEKRFEEQSFLKDVRSIPDPLDLQKQFVYDLLQEDLQSSEKFSYWFDRFKGRKVLIVVDDIDHWRQFNVLIPDIDKLARGSRILVTSRDQNVLSNIMRGDGHLTAMHEVELMSPHDSHQLFNWHAFYNEKASDGFQDLARKVADACRRLPLALEVIGAFLFDKKRPEDRACWDQATETLRANGDILNKLKISYDGLSSDEARLMFKDIACFLIGKDEKMAMQIFESCNSYQGPQVSFHALMDKSLVRLDSDRRIRMHDLLRDMGRNVVTNQSQIEGQRSHLWDPAMAERVLRKNQGTDAVRGLSVARAKDGAALKAETFTKMSELHFLILDNCQVEGDFSTWSEELRWLQWWSLPLLELPPTLSLLNLSVLDLTGSTIVTRIFPKNSNDEFLCKELRMLILKDCTALEELPQTIGKLSRLKNLDVQGCSTLKALPDSVGELLELTQLNLSNCTSLERLPDTIGLLSELKKLWLINCTKLKFLPTKFGKLQNLDEFWADATSLSRLPHSFSQLSNLQDLHLHKCEKIQELPSMSGLVKLKLLHMGHIGVQTLPEDFGDLQNLVDLHLYSCNDMVSLPEGFKELQALVFLEMHHCPNLVDVQGLPWSLEYLDLGDCPKLIDIPSLKNLHSLKSLILCNCTRLTQLQDLDSLITLEKVNLSGCTMLQNVPNLNHNGGLKACYLSGSCISMPIDSDWLKEEPALQLVSYYDDNLRFVNNGMGRKVINKWDANEICMEAIVTKPEECIAIIFSFVAHDQGWSDHHWTHGQYEHGSCSMEARIIRKNEEVFISHLFKLREADKNDQVYFCTLRRRHPFVQALKHGDKICVYARSWYQGWAITVNEGAICMVYSVLGEIHVVENGTIEGDSNVDVQSQGTKEKLTSSLLVDNPESILFKDCTALEELPQSIGKLSRLKNLDVQGCSTLKALPDYVGELLELTQLNLSNCTSLERLPDTIGLLTKLKKLWLINCTKLKFLPTEFGKLQSLDEFWADATSLSRLPHSFSQLSNLQDLHLHKCEKIQELPSMNGLVKLKLLHMGHIGVQTLPEDFGDLQNLVDLHLYSCKNLQTLPQSFGLLQLQRLQMNDNHKLKMLPKGFGGLKSLLHLNISNNSFQQGAVPSDFGGLSALTRLQLQYNDMVSLPEGFKELQALVFLEMHHCPNLVDVQGLPCSLESLNLGDCPKLIPQSIGKLSRLKNLDLRGCSTLKALPDFVGELLELTQLNLSNCTSLERLPDTIGLLSELKKLWLINCTKLKFLPTEFGKLQSLDEFWADATSLSRLPHSFSQLSNLQDLHLHKCEKIQELPSMSGLVKLKLLHMGHIGVQTLPEDFGDLQNLVDLHLYSCKNLQTLPQSFGLLQLQRLQMNDNHKLKMLPKGFGGLKSLLHLNIGNNSFQQGALPSDFGGLSALTRLQLQYNDMVSLPEGFKELQALVFLEMHHCPNLVDVQGLPCSLESLDLSDCPKLIPQSIGKLSRLKNLDLRGCSTLKALPDFVGELLELTQLNLSKCTSLERLPDTIGLLSELKKLWLINCTKLKFLPTEFGKLQSLDEFWADATSLSRLPHSFSQLSNLQDLHLHKCEKIQELPSMSGLVKLKLLHMGHIGVQTLPEDFGDLQNLVDLHLYSCKNLQTLPQSFGLLQLQKLQMNDNHKLKMLPKGFGGLKSLLHLNIGNNSFQQGALPSDFGGLSALTRLQLQYNDMVSLPESFKELQALVFLEMHHCPNLVDVQGLPWSLEYLDLGDCPKLIDIPSLKNLHSLKSLILCNCTRLTQLQDLDSLITLEKVNLSGCTMLQNVPNLNHNGGLKACYLSGSCISMPIDSDWLKEEPALQLVSYYDDNLRFVNNGMGRKVINKWDANEICMEAIVTKPEECIAIIFSFVAHDQGCSMHDRNHGRYEHGRCSMEARIIRNNEEVFIGHLFKLREADKNDQVYFCTLRRQHPFVQALKHGDKICVYARSSYPEWAITVNQGAICVVYSVLGEIHVVENGTIEGDSNVDVQSQGTKEKLASSLLVDNPESILRNAL